MQKGENSACRNLKLGVYLWQTKKEKASALMAGAEAKTKADWGRPDDIYSGRWPTRRQGRMCEWVLTFQCSYIRLWTKPNGSADAEERNALSKVKKQTRFSRLACAFALLFDHWVAFREWHLGAGNPPRGIPSGVWAVSPVSQSSTNSPCVPPCSYPVVTSHRTHRVLQD